MKLLSLSLIFFLFFLISIINVNAITVNENYNFSTEEQANNGLIIGSVNISQCFNAYNYNHGLYLINKTAYDSSINFGIAYADYFLCAGTPDYRTIYFFPESNAHSSVYHVSSGLLKVSLKVFAEITPQLIWEADSPFALEITDYNTGIIYNQTNLTSQDLSYMLNNFTEFEVSYTFIESKNIQIVFKFGTFNNFGGANNASVYFDYFKVEGVSCTPTIYCLNDFDYRVIFANCSSIDGSFAPDNCIEFYNYSFENASTVIGIGKYDNETEQTTNCWNENYESVNCNSLEAGTTNPMDTTALFISGFFGIKNLETSRFMFSLIVSLAISFVALYFGKDNENAHIIFSVAFLGTITLFTLISFFPSWLFIILLIAIGYLVAKTIQKGL